MPMCGLLRSIFRHSQHLITVAVKFAGCTLDRKQCLDFSRLVAGIGQYREWVYLVDCFRLSTIAHISLLNAGGAILNSKYKSLTLVGFRHPVTDQHAWFSTGSSLLA